MLSQGGEGSVYQLPLQPHLVFKSYRSPTDRSDLDRLVSWPGRLAPADEATVRAASAWPTSVVSGAAGEVVGILMPRAPRRFSLRHSDGQRRLATLSYLTCDPARPAKAYGLTVPPACGPGRFGIVLALARLLAAFESATPTVSHGDLSTKNVLWSLEREPEVYVIDCDSADLHCSEGDVSPLGALPDRSRRRAMTPNWDDPAVEKGRNPTAATDRYSLGLIFLRVAGAANFPIQSFQRRDGRVRVEFPVPSGPASRALIAANSEVWRLCARALSVEAPHERPRALDWIDALVEVTASLADSAPLSRFSRGASRIPLRAGTPSTPGTPDALLTSDPPVAGEHVSDVLVEVREVSQRGPGRADRSPLGLSDDLDDRDVSAALDDTGAEGVQARWSSDAASLRFQTAAVAVALWRWWLDAHRASLSALRGSYPRIGLDRGPEAESPGRLKASGAASLAALLVLDLVIVGLAVGFGAVLISPLVR